MAAQLDYGYEMRKGTPGGKYDLSDNTCVTRVVESEDGVIKNGMAVVVGTSAGVQVALPNGTAAFEGVVVRGGFNAENDKEGNATIPQGASISVMTKGKIWVRIAKSGDDYITTKYGDSIYMVKSGDEAGVFTNAAGDTATQVTGRFIGGADNGIAPIELL